MSLCLSRNGHYSGLYTIHKNNERNSVCIPWRSHLGHFSEKGWIRSESFVEEGSFDGNFSGVIGGNSWRSRARGQNMRSESRDARKDGKWRENIQYGGPLLAHVRARPNPIDLFIMYHSLPFVIDLCPNLLNPFSARKAKRILPPPAALKCRNEMSAPSASETGAANRIGITEVFQMQWEKCN